MREEKKLRGLVFKTALACGVDDRVLVQVEQEGAREFVVDLAASIRLLESR